MHEKFTLTVRRIGKSFEQLFRALDISHNILSVLFSASDIMNRKVTLTVQRFGHHK